MAIFSTYPLRLTLQHRALYCYLLLSLWIFLLLGVMYKYIVFESDSLTLLKYRTTEMNGVSIFRSTRPVVKSKKIIQVCNSYKDIRPGAEGNFNSNFSLEGVLVLVRHGDRGPLTHVMNISSVNCERTSDPLYAAYENYINNITGTQVLSQLLGTFNGVPPIPASDCGLGLLTKRGASQLLATGRVLREVYKHSLNINSVFVKDEVKAYSTRYRRTLQSALAFLFAFMNIEDYPKVVLQEASSLAFCFDDCACPSADHYNKMYVLEGYRHLKSHPAVLSLIKATSSIVYEFPDKKISSDPHALKDALLTYICHDSSLPCRDVSPFAESCVKVDHVNGLFSYLNWESKQFAKSRHLKRTCLLRAYGFLKNIVSHLLQIVSERRPRFVLYSGHDKTISYLAVALGITSDGVLSPHYASRLIFEIYKSKSQQGESGGPVGSDYFFRLLFNGKDITTKVQFCKRVANHHPARQQNVTGYRNSSFFLCPLENIVRFLHDDYFAPFNTTNIKDACAL